MLTKQGNGKPFPAIPLSTIKHINMYEEFLEKSLNNKRQAVDDTFIAKYADLSYPNDSVKFEVVQPWLSR